MTHKSTDRTDRKRTGIVILLVLGISILAAAGALFVSVAPDALPSVLPGREENRLYEDGSYIWGIADFSITGCAPVHMWNDEIVLGWCLDGGDSPIGYFDRDSFVWTIGIDSPWEDFLPAPLDSIAYKIIDTYKFLRDL